MVYTQVRTFKPSSGLSDSNILNKGFFQFVFNFVYVYFYIHVQSVRHRERALALVFSTSVESYTNPPWVEQTDHISAVLLHTWQMGGLFATKRVLRQYLIISNAYHRVVTWLLAGRRRNHSAMVGIGKVTHIVNNPEQLRKSACFLHYILSSVASSCNFLLEALCIVLNRQLDLYLQSIIWNKKNSCFRDVCTSLLAP
jgi:hypothetical protein